MIKVGVIGCGTMGKGIVKNLLHEGYEVLIYDIDQKKVSNLVNIGATARDNVQSVAEEVTYLLNSLPKSSVLESVLYGNEGALEAMSPGSYVMDMSTTSVDITRKAFDYARHKGIFYFDCPVSGGPTGAANGNLTIMVGGNKKYFSCIYNVLQSIGKNIYYIGETGAGQIVKLCNNMVAAGITVLLSESIWIGSEFGVSKDKIMEVMQSSSAESKVMKVHGENLLSKSHEKVIFMLKLMSKDVNLYTELAKQISQTNLISKSIDELFKIAVLQGKGELDTSAITEIIENS